MLAMFSPRGRCNLVALVTAGLVGVMMGRPAGGPSVHTPTEAPSGAVVPAAERTWSLSTGGWVIRVDGAVVEVPSLAQQTQPVVHIRGPLPLSPYDQLIAHHAEAEGLDWRLVAALIFEESRFDAEAVSDAGAVGLMQVRPIAAAAVGSRAFKAPNDNIRTGARYLRQLSETLSEASGRDRLALVLAAYNFGPGHLRDAQMLARRVGYNSTTWRESMEFVLALLDQPSICEGLPNGCARGANTAAYVNRILDRYDRYRRQYGARIGDDDDDDGDSDDNPTPDSIQAASANG